MTRGTRIPRTRPSNHHTVIVFEPDPELFHTFMVRHSVMEENEDESSDSSPERKQTKKAVRRKKEPAVAVTQVEEPDADVEELQRKMEEYFDDVADFSLEIENEDGNRLMATADGKGFMPYDEEIHNERQRKREEKLKLSNLIKEKQGEKPNQWLGYCGPSIHSKPKPVEKAREKPEKAREKPEKVREKKSSIPVAVAEPDLSIHMSILPRPDGLPFLRKSLQLMAKRQKSTAVVPFDESLVLFPHHQRKSVSVAKLSFATTPMKEGERRVLPPLPMEDSSASPATTSSDSHSNLASDSFLHPTGSKSMLFRLSGASTSAPGMFKSTPKRLSHMVADLPNFNLSPIGRSSSIMPTAKPNFLTSTPCPPENAVSKREQATEASSSNSTVVQPTSESDDDLCDISTLSIADNAQPNITVKQPLATMENRLSMQEKQSPGSKRSSTENWSNSQELVTPADKKRRTGDVENMDPAEAEEVDATAQSPSLSLRPLELTEDVAESAEESVHQKSATIEPEPKDSIVVEPVVPVEATIVNDTEVQQTLAVEASGFGQTLPVEATAMGNTLEVEGTAVGDTLGVDGIGFGDTLGVTLAADGTALGHTLSVEANDFGITVGDNSAFTNTLLGDVTGMSVVPKTRNTTQILSFYGDESRGVEGGCPYFLKDYNGQNELEQLLFVVHQAFVFPWKDLALKNPRKLGEGVFGEVFATTYSGLPSAVKIIPFAFEGHEYDGLVNGEALWNPGELMAEVLITRELAQLNCPGALFSTPNFIGLLGAHVAMGCYPGPFLKAWDAFDKKKESENDRPSIYSAKNRLHLVICLAMGGSDLEDYTLQNEAQVISILLQVALSLMIAEKVLEFEHRDLHVGNILVMKYDEEISYRFNGEDLVLVSHGVKIDIIDFTLSRLKKDGTVLYRNLSADEELFNGQGNYQFDMYRMMRTSNKDNWVDFSSKSNVFWMHYLSRELLQNKKCAKPIPPARKKKLVKLFDRLLEFDSISELFTEPQFTDVISPFLKK